jgi:3-carboxy-cis,cis-muconate cycloisomerase
MADLADALYTTPDMSAIFSARTFVQRMLDVEAALARAQAQAGLIPDAAAQQITDACRIERFDVDAIVAQTANAASPVVPLLRQLSDQLDENATPYLHWGATSQDIIDTATMLQARDARALLHRQLVALGTATATLAERHRRDPMAGRTLLQQALPITFGLKAAHWLDATARQLDRLTALDPSNSDIIAIQFGGAVGTQAALGEHGLQVMELLAGELQLAQPDLPWHTQRDRIAELAGALAIISGAVAKIATDITLLAQSEVAEVAEATPPGKGGSSTLPHKRNPVDAVLAIAAARVAQSAATPLLDTPAHEHERAAGVWQAEWTLLPRAFHATAAALAYGTASVGGLEVDTDRMRANLDATNGLLMAEAASVALAPHHGRLRAQQLVEQACRRATDEARHLRDVLIDDADVTSAIDETALERLFDPTTYLGGTDQFIDRALAHFQRAAAAPDA